MIRGPLLALSQPLRLRQVPALLVTRRWAAISADWELRASGLRVRRMSSGDQDDVRAKRGQTVRVAYCARLDDGTEIARATTSFRLGSGAVCEALDDGVAGMCVGDRRRLRAPPGLRRGKAIDAPANEIIEYDVQLTGMVQHMRIVALEEPGSDDPLQAMWDFSKKQLSKLTGSATAKEVAKANRVLTRLPDAKGRGPKTRL
jgi:hypothetical protein